MAKRVTNTSPWSADAAVGATGQTYKLRTVQDFFSVPEERRRICLREFHAWMSLHESVPALLVACGASPDTIKPVNADCFTWHDDGEAKMTVMLRPMEGQR